MRPLGTLENIFDYHGRPGHEIVMAFGVRFVDASFYAAERIVGTESEGTRIEAIWLDVSKAAGSTVVSEWAAGDAQRTMPTRWVSSGVRGAVVGRTG